MITNIDELAHRIRGINENNGWNITRPDDWYDMEDMYKIPGVLALVHSEVSEALEAYRQGDQDAFLEEMADVVIRVLDCVGAMTNDFDSIIDAKLERNKTRGFKHGGKRV